MRKLSYKKILPLLLAVAMAAQCFCPAAFADDASAEDIFDPAELQAVRVYVDGLLSGRAYSRDGCIYLPFEALCAFFEKDLSVLRDEQAQTLTLSFPGFTAETAFGADYMLANGRYLYTPVHYALIRDRVYLPIDTVKTLLGLDVTVSDDGGLVSIDGGSLSVISGGENYYAKTFPYSDVFWLPRIIQAEANDQCLAGKIGIGNVVFNRVADADFPNTVFEVIFDTKYCIQFEPVANGSVYNDPGEESVIAAYLALEGYNTAGDAEYFVDPERGSDSWFRRDLDVVCTIGDHTFFRERD